MRHPSNVEVAVGKRKRVSTDRWGFYAADWDDGRRFRRRFGRRRRRFGSRRRFAWDEVAETGLLGMSDRGVRMEHRKMVAATDFTLWFRTLAFRLRVSSFAAVVALPVLEECIPDVVSVGELGFIP